MMGSIKSARRPLFSRQGERGPTIINLGDGGSGGNGNLLVTGVVSMDSSDLTLEGGAGNLSEAGNGGNGANASLSSGNLSITSSYHSVVSSLYISGGMAGGNNDELASGLSGNGGSAILTSGVVSVDSSTAQVDGGSGNVGYGYAGVTEGSGGNASVSFESLNLTSNRHGVSSSIGVISNFTVVGGAGSSDSAAGAGGNGGNAMLAVAGAVSVDSSSLNVQGNGGGNALGAGGGNGGSGSFSAGSLDITTHYSFGIANLLVQGGGGGKNSGLIPRIRWKRWIRDPDGIGRRLGGFQRGGSARQ